MTRYLHMSIGPVQTFVEQSRRTRDLWASSYLLSFLAASAMHRAVGAGGDLVSPQMASNRLWQWLEDRTRALPDTGSAPNQFTIAVRRGMDGPGLAAAARRGFEEAWSKIATAVWAQFVSALATSNGATTAIWERQVAGFWELAWIVDGDELPTGLRARKGWRTLELPDEPGDKCTVIPELQELSGEIRARGADTRARQDLFWEQIRGGKQVGALDLDPEERLSAIALIKRLFPLVANSALGRPLDQVRWPSTVDLAAIPWSERVVSAAPAAARTYANAVVEVRGAGARSGGVSAQVKTAPGGDAGAFTAIDANWFQASYVTTAELEPPLAADDRGRLGALLAALHKAVDAAGQPLGAPPIYYALLLADGDRLGTLRGPLGAARLSASLGRFSEGVEALIEARRGVTVYAGGDDVLALLPIDRALDCAAALECSYRAAFEDNPLATLSAAVVFAHAHAPLDQILALGHRLLDDVAKEENGRASLVVAVTRRSDPAAQWVTTWQRPEMAAVKAVDELVAKMTSDQRLLSGALDHAIWELLRRLGSGVAWRPGTFARVGAALDLEPLIRAAVLQSLSHRDGEDLEVEASTLTGLIHPLLRPARNRDDASPYAAASAAHVAGEVASSDPVAAQAEPATQEVGLDALLVARFVAGGGLEGEHQS